MLQYLYVYKYICVYICVCVKVVFNLFFWKCLNITQHFTSKAAQNLATKKDRKKPSANPDREYLSTLTSPPRILKLKPLFEIK